MRSLKFLMVIMVVFALVLSACASDGGQNEGATTPVITEGAGLGNENLNGNDNSGLGVNGNENAAALATSTPASMATPLGTALGTPAATDEMAVATETVGPLSTEVMTTETPAVDALGTPVGTEAADMGDVQTFENGILLSNLIGAGIEDVNGDGWGTIDSVLFDQATCTVPYVLVRVDDFPAAVDPAAATAVAPAATTDPSVTASPEAANANDNSAASTQAPGMGGTETDATGGDLVLVPLSAFYAEGQQGVLTLPLTVSAEVAEIVSTAQRYSDDTLPDWNLPDWDVDVRPLWAGFPVTVSAGTDADANDNSAGTVAAPGAGLVRLTDVTDLNAVNANDEDLGDIEDVVVMLNNQPAYIFLAVGGVLDMGERLIPVPCDLVTWQVDENGNLESVVVNTEQEMLENAPGLDEIPAAFDAGWDTDYSTYWAGGGMTVPATTPAGTPAATPTP